LCFMRYSSIWAWLKAPPEDVAVEIDAALKEVDDAANWTTTADVEV
jgi:hypothetical protein